MQPNTKGRWIAILAIVAVFQFFALIIGFGTDYYTSHFLRWTVHEQRLMLFSGGSVMSALFLLVWVRLADNKSVEPQNQHLVGQNIMGMAGWTVLCLALTFGENNNEWHIIREVYFAMALIASLLIIYSYFWKYKHTADEIAKKASLIGVLYVWLPPAIIWRYCTGAQGFF